MRRALCFSPLATSSDFSTAVSVGPLASFHRGLTLTTLLWHVSCGLCCAAQAPDAWHSEPQGRWRDLPVAGAGKAGFVELAPQKTGVFFTNVLDEWSGAANRVLENGSGVAVGDFDGDGRPDIFLCSLQGRNALYRNLGSWRFEDVTLKSGIDATNYICRGAVFADLNGDGWLDLLISTLGRGVLCYLNDGTGKFTNATASAGTETRFGSTTLTLADFDGNGTLDLYVANYRTSDIRDVARIGVRWVNGKMEFAPEFRDRLIMDKGGMMEFGEPDILYVNDGKGRFTALPWNGGKFLNESGDPLAAPPTDWGLSAAFRDINGDGRPDLYVCNDYWTPDRVWINQGNGVFQAIPRLALRHTSENSMGVDFADIDRDGNMDFVVLDMLSRDGLRRKAQAPAQTKMGTTGKIGEITNCPQIMQNTLFHSRGDGTFEEIADFAGLAASDWSWQPAFLDVDLDGYEDLVISAGHRTDVQDLDATSKILALQHRWPKEIDPKAHQEAFTREMMEHSRLYPRLEMPVVTFRNRGDLKFEEMTSQWGTGSLGVHQGLAFGDFDSDGALDFVVNNLNGVAGIYRNLSSAPRIAVRLKGLPPNTRGIGAKLSVYGGAVPQQSQEMICGGRYLSSDEAVRVFAAGTLTNEMQIEVKWPSGRRSLLAQVRANRVYEIDEGAAGLENPAPKAELTPVFEDVSQLLRHSHREEEFDDFARQPLLPRKLSQLGPGAAWIDLDGDGWEDLVIGSGKGGVPAFYRNDHKGGFEKLNSFTQPVTRDQTAIASMTMPTGATAVLAGAANYEDGLASGEAVTEYNPAAGTFKPAVPAWGSSVGALALGDLDGDGDLDLFVGGRVVPGRYPEPATSRIYLNDGGTFRLHQELKEVGLVSGAVWSDLDGDGYPELILACEWGPVRIFRNEHGSLTPWNPPVQLSPSNPQRTTLDQLTGWWNGVTTGDVDGDGRMDIIISNWGRNTHYECCRQEPLRIYYGDFNGDGAVQMLEAWYAPALKGYTSWRPLNPVAAAMPWVRGHFETHAAFAAARVEDVLADKLSGARQLAVATLDSMVFLNRGDYFEARPLPAQAQFSPGFDVRVGDFDGDGKEDVFLSQNFFAVNAETLRYDAGRGLWLRGDGAGNFTCVPGQESGIKVYGEQRGCALCDYDQDGRVDLVVTQNGGETKLFHNTKARPGLRVRIKGPPGDPAGVGARLRLVFGNHEGPMREIHDGSGYWSQDAFVQVLSTPEAPTQIRVNWPGGKNTASPVPPNAAEISINYSGDLQLLRSR